MEIRIDTFDDLIQFLKANDLTPSEVNEIVNRALKCFVIGDRSKDEMIESLIVYWAKWKHTDCRPIFIDYDPLQR
jgi:hypothetical protein